MTSKCKVNNGGNSAKPKRRCGELPLCYKMKVIDLVVKEKSLIMNSALCECALPRSI